MDESPLTNRHHVVPAIQVAQVKVLAVGRGGRDEHGDVPVAVLQDTYGPRAQEPADRHQHDHQDPQQMEAGHVRRSLRRARQEGLQHPEERRDVGQVVSFQTFVFSLSGSLCA